MTSPARAGWRMLAVFIAAQVTLLAASVLVLVPFAATDPAFLSDGRLGTWPLLALLVVPSVTAALVAVAGTALVGPGSRADRVRRELAFRRETFVTKRKNSGVLRHRHAGFPRSPPGTESLTSSPTLGARHGPRPDRRRARTRDLVRHGAALDDVRLVRYAAAWPVAGTRAQRRARRQVLAWFTVSVLSGLAFLGVYLFWPWRYAGPGEASVLAYELYTPLLGLTLGLAFVALSFGLIVYTRRFLPREVAVQQRHDEPSPVTDQETTGAILADSARHTGLTRRSWLGRALAAGTGVAGLGTATLVGGSFVRDPWDTPKSQDSLWHTAWASRDGETVYLRRDLANAHDVVLTRPADLEAGSMVTVVPFRESDLDDPEALAEAVRRADSAAMLFRLRPGEPVVPRAGHEEYHYGDFYAYSKLCTHLGCPVSLFERNVNRLLCPCHQSQFDLNTGAVPIFGPAVRALPELPIDLDENGYFVATGDFSEPVGPGFWELSE